MTDRRNRKEKRDKLIRIAVTESELKELHNKIPAGQVSNYIRDLINIELFKQTH